MPESALDVWLLKADEGPLVHAVRPERRGRPRMPFVGVIEAYVLQALRDLKLPMEQIQKLPSSCAMSSTIRSLLLINASSPTG